MTARPVRNVFFKTCLSSNAAYYNKKRTSSAVCEDASAATLDESRGQYGSEPPGEKQQQAGDSLKTHNQRLCQTVSNTVVGQYRHIEWLGSVMCAYEPAYGIVLDVLNIKIQRISHDLL